MKKTLLLAFTAAAVLSGCNAAKQPKSVLDFTTENSGYKFSLASDDNFDTAVMTDSKGDKRILKHVPAADGIKMVDDKGTSVHFKKGYGILNLNGGADTNVMYQE